MNQAIRRSVKLLVAFGLYYSGLLWLLFRYRLRGRVTVLMYHRVLTDSERAQTFSHPAIVIGVSAFERQLAFLKKHLHVLSGSEFLDHLRGNAVRQRPACLITFDDGWIDNHTHAYPLLRKHQAPAVIFLTTGLMDGNEGLQRERIAARLYQLYLSGDQQALDSLDEPGLHMLTRLNPEASHSAIHNFITGLKQRSDDRNSALERRIEQLAGNSDHPSIDHMMSWQQTREMAANGITFGGHTVNHKILIHLPPDRVKEEVAMSRTALQHHLSGPADLFAYPNGNFDPTAVAAVQEAGFSCAFSTHSGHVSPGDAPWTLPRINVTEDCARSMPLFLCRILGIL